MLRIYLIISLVMIFLLAGCQTSTLKESSTKPVIYDECLKEDKNCQASKKRVRYAPPLDEPSSDERVLRGNLSGKRQVPKDQGVSFDKDKPILIKFPGK